MILESDTPAVTQFSVGDLKAGDKFRVLFPVFNRAEGLRVSVRKKDGSLEELKLNQGYAVLIPPNSGQAGYTAEVEYIGEERTDIYVFIVERAIRLSQETNLSSYGAEGRNQEFSLDKLTCILQDTRTGLRISSSEVNNPLTGTPKLELPYNRANSILAFDENKNVRAVPEYTGEEGVKISEHNVVSMDMDTMPVATEDHSGVMSKEDKVKVNALREVAFSGLNESSGLNIKGNVLNLNTASVSSRGGIRLVPEGTVLNNLFKTWGSEGLAIAPLPPAGDAPDKLGGVFIDLSDGENLTKINEDGKLTTAVPLASRERDGLMSKSDKANMEDLHIIAYSGLYMDLSNKPNNASITSDGFMSKEDKIKLNAAMKFPDGEAGCTLPNASGRADKLITFDSGGNIDLHSTHDYDKWRNVRISTAESTVGLNLELPNPTERANKVIGFSSDGKSVEMREVGGTDITVGKGLQKNGNEISLMSAGDAHVNQLGGIYRSSRSENDLLMIEPDGQAYAHLPIAQTDVLGGIKVGSGLNIDTDGVLSVAGGDGGEFVNDPIFVGNVQKQLGFKAVNKMNIFSVQGVGSFLLNGRLTFFCGEYRGKIWYSYDCKHWYPSTISSSLKGIVPTSFCKIRYNNMELICTACAEKGDIAYSQDFGKYFRYEKVGAAGSNKIISINDVAFSLCNNYIYAGTGKGFTEYHLPLLGNIKDCAEFNGYYYCVCEKNGAFTIQRGMYVYEIFQPEWEEVYRVSGAAIMSIVNDGTRLLIAVNKLSNSTDIMQSTNGTTWTKLSTVNYLAQNLSGESGKYVLFASEGAFYVTDNTFNNLRSVYAPLKQPHYDVDTGLFTGVGFGSSDFCVSATAYVIGG